MSGDELQKRLLDGCEFVSVPEAAGLLGYDERVIRRGIRNGEIPVTQVGADHRVPTSWIRTQALSAEFDERLDKSSLGSSVARHLRAQTCAKGQHILLATLKRAEREHGIYRELVAFARNAAAQLTPVLAQASLAGAVEIPAGETAEQYALGCALDAAWRIDYGSRWLRLEQQIYEGVIGDFARRGVHLEDFDDAGG